MFNGFISDIKGDPKFFDEKALNFVDTGLGDSENMGDSSTLGNSEGVAVG
jgi:hypothetical protein